MTPNAASRCSIAGPLLGEQRGVGEPFVLKDRDVNADREQECAAGHDQPAPQNTRADERQQRQRGAQEPDGPEKVDRRMDAHESAGNTLAEVGDLRGGDAYCDQRLDRATRRIAVGD